MFLLAKLPAAVVLLGMLCQILARPLSHVQVRRNRSDDLALAVTRDHSSHRIVLLGDSVTRDSTSRFALGKARDDVVNLSTTAAVGIPGEYFLLERYLEAHPPPKYVVLSFSPEVYYGIASTTQLHHYLWPTFSKPEEHALLKRFLPDIDYQDRLPAAMDMGGRIGDRFYGLFKRTSPELPFPSVFPTPSKKTEPISENLATASTMTARVKGDLPLSVRHLEMESLSQICDLTMKHSIEIKVVWPPAPINVAEEFRRSNIYLHLQQQIAEAFKSRGCYTTFLDMNSLHEYGNFRLDAMHVRGEGWEERVASDYHDFLAQLSSAPTLASERASSRTQ
jgi:hypothetical protein